MDYEAVKPLLTSRTVWSAIVGFLATALAMFGVPLLDGVDQSTLVTNILGVVQGVSFILAIVFRAGATKKLV